MRELIYYPDFEVKDANWLKFALLYLRRLDSIVPETANENLSELYRKLRSETDLLALHRPDPEEGRDATRDAIGYAEDILKHSTLYDISQEELESWRRPEKHDYILWRAKYHD